MAKDRMDVLELLRKEAADADLDFLREGLRVLMQAVMEAEVVRKTGAGLGERSSDRLTHRNGYRSRPWDTRVGTLELQIPKVREGSYFPSLLEPRRRSERALLAVVQQAYVGGRFHPPCRGPRASPRLRGHLEEPGLAYLPGARWGGGPVPRQAAGRRAVSLPVAGRADPEGARGRPDRQRQCRGGDCGQR